MNPSLANRSTVHGEPAAAPVSGALPDLPGYDVAELVGRGGMGKVYRARHLGLGRTVAVKLLALDPDEKSLARFRDEARAVAKLQHPNIAQVFDTGTADGRPFFAQEFLDGGSLAQKFAGAPQDPRYAAGIVETLARAIQHSHDHGILHRDLKPGNVLLAADGTPKVTDFGLAKEIAPTGDTAAESGGGLTRTGEILGTPAYMPPEQASGVFTGIGPAADVYALGAILYEAVTGRPPFQAPDALQTLLMVLGMDPVSPRTLQPKLPKDLETICLKCLEKSPRRRYPSADALADDLHRFLADEPIVARPVGFLERSAKWARRRKAAAALLAVSVLFAAAMVGAGVWLAVSFAQLAEAKRDVDDANADLTAAKTELEGTNTKLTTAKTELEGTNTQLAAAKTDLEGTNVKLRAANDESNKSYQLATDALDKIVRQVTTKLQGMPQAEALLLEMLAEASELNRQLVAARPNDVAAVERYLGTLAQRMATETGYAKVDASEKTRAEMRRALAAALPQWPKEPLIRMYEAQEAYQGVLNGVGNMTKVRQRMADVTDEFAKDFPDHWSTRTLLVKKWWAVAAGCGDDFDFRGQVEAYDAGIAVARKLTGEEGRYIFLCNSLLQKGAVLRKISRYPEADAALAEAQAVYDDGATKTKMTDHCKGGAASVRLYRAAIRVESGKPEEGKKLYAEAEGILRQLEREYPMTQVYKLDLAECLLAEAKLVAATDPAAARKLVDEAVALADKLVRLVPDNTRYKEIRDKYVAERDALPPKK